MMNKLLATMTVALGFVGATLAMGCGSSGSSDGASSDLSATCAAPASSAPSSSSRKVSFAADVMPVFVQSCAFGSCHGSPKGANNGVFLGAKGGANDAAAIRAGLVGRPSSQGPSLPYVTPSDPSQSYLFRKLTDFCGLSACDGDRCGQRMPRGGDPLDPAALETVRAWIAQGALE
jgi:hypothetical protein